MQQTRVFRTESFRLAALFAVLFLGLAGTLIAVVYWIVNNNQTDVLIGAIDSDISTLKNGFRDGGFAEATEIVHQRLGTAGRAGTDFPGGYILIEDRAKGRVEGNISIPNLQRGLFSVPKPKHAAGQPDGTVLGRGEFVTPDLYVFAGRDTALMAATRASIVKAFAWIACAAIAIAGIGGVLFSVQFMRRIDAITRTCQAIVAGKFSDRIALRGNGDELDSLATVINDMLDRISTLLDNLRQVSSDVAHDLRTPMTHLRNRLDEARLKSVTTQDYSSAVTRAIDDTDQILGIFAALLRISQIEAGTRLASLTQVSLSDLLERIYEMYRPVAEDNAQTLGSDVQPGVYIQGDSELLTQLFSNLVENAIHHTPKQTRISIALTGSDREAVASISDNGPGIDRGERDKVFRRFYRVAASRSNPGNGLGLALVAAIAGLHEATVQLSDNEPGTRNELKFSNL